MARNAFLLTNFFSDIPQMLVLWNILQNTMHWHLLVSISASVLYGKPYQLLNAHRWFCMSSSLMITNIIVLHCYFWPLKDYGWYCLLNKNSVRSDCISWVAESVISHNAFKIKTCARRHHHANFSIICITSSDVIMVQHHFPFSAPWLLLLLSPVFCCVFSWLKIKACMCLADILILPFWLTLRALTDNQPFCLPTLLKPV